MTLECVFRQTWPNIEIIVVDDGSTDNSVQVIERAAGRRLHLIRQANAGAGSARNRAYRASKGEFIQFLDADDLLTPNKIEVQVRRLQMSPKSVASCHWGRFFSSMEDARTEIDTVSEDLSPIEWLVRSRGEGQGMLFPALWLVPRPIVDAAGPWDENLSLGDDGEYFTRVVLASERILFCSASTSYYRSGLIDSLSGHKSLKAWRSQFRVIELCETRIRAREDSDRVRRCFALSWQHLAHGCYPYDRALAELSLARARDLHTVSITPDGGRIFHIASRLFGWRMARRLQVASGRP